MYKNSKLNKYLYEKAVVSNLETTAFLIVIF